MTTQIPPLQIIDIYRSAAKYPQPLPAFLSGVPAGFPSPADDYIEKQLDLNDLVIKHPAATFFVRVEGESMREAWIRNGDILVVDRALQPAHGKIVVAVMNGEFTVKRICIDESGISLVPENASYAPIPISPESDFQVWGVVTYVIHRAQ